MEKKLVEQEGQKLKKEFWVMFIFGIIFSCFFVLFVIELLWAISNDEYFITNETTLTKLLIWFVFSLMGFVSLGISIKKLADYTTRKNILKNGQETTATYVSCKIVANTPNFEMFKIIYTFFDKKGKKRTQKSIFAYSKEEMTYYKNLGTFLIKYYKNKSVIVQIYDPKNSQANVIAHSEKVCYYCGSALGPQDKKCPNCGSKKFKN